MVEFSRQFGRKFGIFSAVAAFMLSLSDRLNRRSPRSSSLLVVSWPSLGRLSLLMQTCQCNYLFYPSFMCELEKRIIFGFQPFRWHTEARNMRSSNFELLPAKGIRDPRSEALFVFLLMIYSVPFFYPHSHQISAVRSTLHPVQPPGDCGQIGRPSRLIIEWPKEWRTK